MTDPVDAERVVDMNMARWDVWPEDASRIVDALLAYGGGDPVVIMPDGTLRRAQADDGWETVTADDGLPSLRVRDDLYRLIDPVQPT